MKLGFFTNDINDGSLHFNTHARVHVGGLPDAAFPNPALRQESAPWLERFLPLCRRSRLCARVDDAILARQGEPARAAITAALQSPDELPSGVESEWLRRNLMRISEASESMGARFAVVNDPPASGMPSIDCLVAAGVNGVPCPTTFLDPGPVVCIQSGCTGGDPAIFGPFDSAAFTAIVNRMNAIHDAITPANVRVEYRHVGLGFSGNPFGSDITPLVTVSLIGMNFNFLTPGLHGLVTLAMPDFRTTMTAEDQSTN